MRTQQRTEEQVEVRQEAAVASFQEMLKDVSDLVQAVAPHCESLTELVELCELGATNETQARILIDLVMTRPKQGGR